MAELTNCPACNCAHFGAHCDNPACRSNPTVSPAQIARWDADAAMRQAEEAERQRIRDIRTRMYASR